MIEKEIAERSFAFVEYVGSFPNVGRNSQLINSGGGYRIDDHHQIDSHIGFGLDRNAPNYIFDVGYSFRLDGPRDPALSSRVIRNTIRVRLPALFLRRRCLR